MVKGSDGETCCRLLLLEATPGNLAEARLAWPSTDVFKRALSETQGVADQISREKIQIVFSDLSGAGCSALNVLSQIRRVHPQLPLVVILPEEDIFQEYSQLGELDAGKPSGIGVGLATCRAILRQMQGEFFLNLKMRKGLQSVFFCQPEWS